MKIGLQLTLCRACEPQNTFLKITVIIVIAVSVGWMLLCQGFFVLQGRYAG